MQRSRKWDSRKKEDTYCGAQEKAIQSRAKPVQGPPQSCLYPGIPGTSVLQVILVGWIVLMSGWSRQSELSSSLSPQQVVPRPPDLFHRTLAQRAQLISVQDNLSEEARESCRCLFSRMTLPLKPTCMNGNKGQPTAGPRDEEEWKQWSYLWNPPEPWLSWMLSVAFLPAFLSPFLCSGPLLSGSWARVCLRSGVGGGGEERYYSLAGFPSRGL